MLLLVAAGYDVSNLIRQGGPAIYSIGPFCSSCYQGNVIPLGLPKLAPYMATSNLPTKAYTAIHLPQHPLEEL